MFIIFNNTPYYEMHELFQSCIFSYVIQKIFYCYLRQKTQGTFLFNVQCPNDTLERT